MYIVTYYREKNKATLEVINMHLGMTLVVTHTPHPRCQLSHQYMRSCSLVVPVMELLYINLLVNRVCCKDL